mmetsp:Transcript_73636/g.161285  ORF Transcript_73636/g.161285 Transcript_73636/m.161285 type:complete len:422 (-) Transcript_73636:59-1324(-)
MGDGGNDDDSDLGDNFSWGLSQEEEHDDANDNRPNNASRAYGAATFEEEKQLIIERSRSQRPGDGNEWQISGGDYDEEFVTQFMGASAQLHDDKEAVLSAVSKWGESLEFCSERLRGDEEVMLAAIENHAGAYRFLSAALWSVREPLVRALQVNGMVLEFVDDVLLGDKEIVLLAVRQVGLALKFASEELRGDKEVLFAALESFPEAFRLAPVNLRAERDVLIRALQKPSSLPSVLGSASLELQQDEDLVLLAVRSMRNLWYGKQVYIEAWLKANINGPLPNLRPWQEYEDASQVKLAIPGEECVVLAVTLSHGPNPTRQIELNKSDGASMAFNCDVSMLSGSGFTFSIADETIVDFTGHSRPGPIVDNVVKQSLASLSDCIEAEPFERIFLVLAHENCEPMPLRPWDWNLSLASLLSQAT